MLPVARNSSLMKSTPGGSLYFGTGIALANAMAGDSPAGRSPRYHHGDYSVGGNMRAIACRMWIMLAIFGLNAHLAFGQTAKEPLSDRELLALVAGNSLSETIVQEIGARGLKFHPDDKYRSLLTEGGADSRVLTAIEQARVISDSPTPENTGVSQSLVHIATAGKLLRAKQYDEAIRELTDALQDGGGVEAGFVMAEVLVRQEKWVEAEAIMEQVQRQAPSFPEAHTKQSYLMYRVDDGEDAFSEARLALSENPNNAEAHKNAGLALKLLNKIDASEKEYREALRLKPDYGPVHFDLGILFEESKKYDQAIVEYKKAIALDFTFWEVPYNLGCVYDSKGNLELAIREYREAKRLNPAAYAPRQNLGHDLIALNMNAEAIKEFREMEGMWPDASICHDCLGTALFRNWDFQGAEKEFRSALSIDPSDADAHVGLGGLLEEQKDYDRSLEEYRRAEKLDEASINAFEGAGRVLIAKKDFSGAVEELKRDEYLNPSNATIHDLYGQALEGLGNTSGAIAEFKQAIALDPKQDQIRLELAAALEKNDNWVEAINQYHQAAMANPRPETQEQYKSAQARFNQHMAALRASGKSAEAATLGSSLHASKVDPGISEELDAIMEAGLQAMIAGHFDEAEVNYKQAVELAEKLQPHDMRLATSLLRLANCYAGKKDFPKTESAMQRALTETEKLYGAESPMMTEPLQALAQYSAFRGDFKSALDFASRAVKVNEDTFGETSDRVADNLRILARVYVMQKEYDKAEPYLLRAVRIDESLFGRDGFGLNIPLTYLCDLYDKWMKPELAEPRYRQLLALLEKQYGPDSPVLTGALAGESKMLQELGRTEEAAKVDQRLQAIRVATGQPEGPPSAQLPK